MIRIIAGLILVLGNIGSIITRPPYIDFSNTARAAGEITGYAIAKIIIFGAAIWLIRSGIKKRKMSKNPNSHDSNQKL